MRLIVPLVTLAFIAPAAAQQPTATATLTLRGVVVTANDAPLPRVRVALAPAALSPELMRLAVALQEPGVLTDADGRFTLRVPARASLPLSFTKARYVSLRVDVSPNELTASGSEIRVRMPLSGAISGQVLERSGAPLMMATVALRSAGFATPVLTTTTNDIGEYRFGGLAEGSYVVTAKSSLFALGAEIADRQKLIDAASVETPAINVSGAEIGNVNLTVDPPSEMDFSRTIGSDPDATGSVSGRVVGVDGLPVARAVVHAYRPFVAGRQVETDLRGRYRIDRLAPGDYMVDARKYGFDTTRGRAVTLRTGQAVDSIDMTLTRGGAIAGTIVDEFGDPLQDVAMSVLQTQVVNGRTRVVHVSVLGGARTDDRGRYRLFGLKPGAYVVQAVVRDALPGPTGYLPHFYPGTPTIDQATPARVDFSTVVSGIDIALVPTPTYRVTGVATDPSGKPGRGEALLAVSERSGAIQTEMRRAEIAADGSFEFTGVAPGDYVVQARGAVISRVPGAIPQTQFSTSFVTVVAADPPPVQLRMTAGATLSGRVRYEGVPPGPPPLLTLTLRWAERDLSPLRTDGSTAVSRQADDSFEFREVFGPGLFQAQPQRNDWYLKSVVFKGQDITDTAFDFGAAGTVRDIEVVISALGATAAGLVTSERGAPVRDAAVLVFSTSRERWFEGSRWVKTEWSNESGAFTVTGLPPGDYWIAAIDRPDRTVERRAFTPDRDLLDSLSPRAIRITLGEGESQDLALRLQRR